MSDYTITPAAAITRAQGINPEIRYTGMIFPLGEGDEPGFTAWMIARAIYYNLTAAGLGAGLPEPDASNADEWQTILFGGS